MDNRKLAALRQLLYDMEKDVGLDQMNSVQRDMLYAANLVAAGSDSFTTGKLRKHPMVQSVAKPTFFRGLKALVEAGLIAPDPHAPNGTYRLIVQ